MPKTHNTSAQAVYDTWARGCDHHVFMSSETHPVLNVHDVHLSGPESRDKIWEKTIKAWKHTYNEFGNDYDWFLKADDDTYVMTDNLRLMLDEHNPDEANFFGGDYTMGENESVCECRYV
eukprot:m.105512 g.105512  ORF g.105512 m.105512 type:complete len:120 (+) comp22495_c0_seq2:137-496(+)